MASYANELEENFTTKDTNKDTAQTMLPRDIVKRFANRRSKAEGWMQFGFHVSFILGSQYLVYLANPVFSTNLVSYCFFWIANWAALLFCGYTIPFIFHGLHEWYVIIRSLIRLKCKY